MPFSFYCLKIQSLFEIIKNVYIESSYLLLLNESILLLVISDKRRFNCGLVLDTVFRYYAICHPTLFQANREQTNVSADCVIAAFAGIVIQVPSMMIYDVRFIRLGKY